MNYSLDKKKKKRIQDITLKKPQKLNKYYVIVGMGEAWGGGVLKVQIGYRGGSRWGVC